MTDLTPTEDELLTHEGRKICEAKELGGVIAAHVILRRM